MNKGGFSWKRLIGYSAAKAKVSRKIGIPLTKSGRDQKIGRIVSKGCLGMLAAISLPILVFIIFY
ncbi:hypothetical protein [Xanthomarina sp.]|uniref:hypothetical protein n=1 Tax=Xanthomarina sp. TaxID=1931211 RepID=UPI002C9D30F2|nr:hypothetical protein [Xanthomarina sp.]HLV39107.1 hypothetical protein [Xanthomarina sp.]